MQYQRLAQEMQDAAVAGLIQRRPRIKASRSLPAIVMKPAPKPRVRKERYRVDQNSSNLTQCMVPVT